MTREHETRSNVSTEVSTQKLLPSNKRGVPIEFEGVSKTYQTRGGGVVEAVAPTTFRIDTGEFVSVVGPSGCGKTTLLMICSGLTSPSAGTVSVNEQPVRGPQTDIGIVFQEPTLLPWRSVLDNVMLQIEIRKLSREEYHPRALRLLEATGLAGFEDSKPSELSGGMRQRVSLVRSLIHQPELLLMDEPFGALDAITRDQMNIDIQRLWMNQRQTVLFVTHSVTEAIFLSDRVLVMTPRPGRLYREIEVDLPRPRTLSDHESPQFGNYVSQIREIFLEFGVLQEGIGVDE